MYTHHKYFVPAVMVILIALLCGCSSTTMETPEDVPVERAVSQTFHLGRNFDQSFPFQNVLAILSSTSLFFFPDTAVNGDAYAAWTFDMTGESGLEYVQLDWNTAPSMVATVYVWDDSISDWQILVAHGSHLYHIDDMQLDYEYDDVLTIKVVVDEDDNNCELEDLTLS